MNSMLLSTWLDKTVKIPIDDDLFYEELKKRIATSKVKKKGSVILNTEGTYGGK